MATKMKLPALNGVHTAGIFSDMTVDGPEIGTLVVIVDRAKNLPNRKSIGKQDPYCAARLGKEAKKTETDRRGGQTPRWDQELRFTVHDSPDYYQLKVSVFNDDKKTDLIGECWVNLQEVVVPGGGQNDLWHNLNCKGKYAGEIRIEITYYDTRPKNERVSDKVRQATSNGATEGGRDSMSGPRQQQKAPVKRRPLPSDPTGASQSPSQVPEAIPTPPRALPSPHTQIQTQSPLQALEYNTPNSQRYSQQHQPYAPSPTAPKGYATAPGMIAVTPSPRPMPEDRYEIYDPAEGSEYIPGNILGRHDDPIQQDQYDPHLQYDSHQQYDSHKEYDPNPQYDTQHANYEQPSFDQYNTPPSPGGPPPPPPAHRSHHASPAGTSFPSHQNHSQQQTHQHQDRSFNAVRQDQYRHSMPNYTEKETYQPYVPPKVPNTQDGYGDERNYQQTPPRHHSYDDRYNGQYNAMQPSVEDAPTSPNPFQNSYHGSGSRSSQYDDPRYDTVPSPAPLNLSGRGSAASGRQSTTSSQGRPYYNGPPSSGSPVSYRDQSQMSSDLSSRTSYSHQSSQSQGYRRQSGDQMGGSPGGYMPPVPPTLVAGIDPRIAQEVSDRMYNENRTNYNQNANFQPRGRYQEQPPHSQQHQHRQSHQHPMSRSDGAPVPFVPAAAAYDDRQSRVATNTYAPIVKPRAISPDPRVPMRKSVSPAPPASQASTETRRLSGVPFGPDAYDMLNPNVTPGKSGESNKETPTVDPDAKIIMHDGREIDPSDHLPESTWAAEPEVRGPKPKQVVSHRPSPSGAQPMPPSGRRQLRMAPARPQSMNIPSASSPYMSGGLSDPSTPAPAAGRNRLQKKSNRMSAQPAPYSSPLAPVSHYQDNSHAPRSLPRAHTMDFSGENGYSTYDNRANQGYRGSVGAGGPPIPAKVPMNYGPPPPPPEESAWALLEEMKSIDLGSGRARRKGHAVV